MQTIRSAIAQAGGGPFWLADARIIQDGALARVDIRIEDGRIAALAPLGTATDGISLDGGQVWPGLVDGHTHLDKGHIWPRMKNATGDFAGAIAAVMADRGAAWTAEDIAARADFALRAAYAYGTVAIRSHIDSYLPLARTTWPVFSELRARWEGRIALQMSSIAPLDRFQGPEGDELADLVQQHGGVLGMVTRLTGGIHAELPVEFQPMLDHFFGLAEARGLDLDL
ncbi:MAG: cytosine deaminase, partial [Rhodospirillales bacterium]|nr:cytosine deaminase [Rhodospirillales bacterium]